VADDWLAAQFDARRGQLRAVALRIRGTPDDADDAVQEAWLRIAGADRTAVTNLGGWLTTIVARVSLEMLRHHEVAAARRGSGIRTGLRRLRPTDRGTRRSVPTLGAALVVVLDTLSPSERLACVLHDMFAVPFDEIAPVLGRSSAASKMLASRARRKVNGDAARTSTRASVERDIVRAFLAASRTGNFHALVGLPRPEVVLAADAAAVRMGAPAKVRGADGVAAMFSGRALAAQPADVEGGAGIVWAVGGRPTVVWECMFQEGRIIHMEMLADAEALAAITVDVLEDRRSSGQRRTATADPRSRAPWRWRHRRGLPGADPLGNRASCNAMRRRRRWCSSRVRIAQPPWHRSRSVAGPLSRPSATRRARQPAQDPSSPGGRVWPPAVRE
jgi:RNA polymerase sigma-70 factor (ECF subfamily)